MSEQARPKITLPSKKEGDPITPVARPHDNIVAPPVQARETVQAAAPKAPPLPEPQRVSPWHPIAEAPRDGQYVYLEGDPNRNNEWYFYQTREFNAGYWMQTGWFRQRFAVSSVKPQFELKGYRLVKEGLPEK